jgi:hypothetical protein
LAIISAPAFIRNLKNPIYKFFTTSLYKINYILEDRNLESPAEEETEEQILRHIMPKKYYNLINVFSKSASDKLPPYRLYNHKIQLKGDLLMGYSLLYKQTTEELQAIKEYITENLQKGFIKHSSAPFTSPILFVKKPNKGL